MAARLQNPSAGTQVVSPIEVRETKTFRANEPTNQISSAAAEKSCWTIPAVCGKNYTTN
jgi:hypothetical protein